MKYCYLQKHFKLYWYKTSIEHTSSNAIAAWTIEVNVRTLSTDAYN